MKIFLGADHAGFPVKESFKAWLRALGHEVCDEGCGSLESCDYPDYAARVARAVSREQGSRGILVCGSGIGMSMAANKIKGVRAALCCNEEAARLSRAHNDANVLCLGARMMEEEALKKVTKAWLETAFEGGRHGRRVEKISKLEG